MLDSARDLAQQFGIPASELTLVNRETTYTHNDPSSASPDNEFLESLTPFLWHVGKPRT